MKHWILFLLIAALMAVGGLFFWMKDDAVAPGGGSTSDNRLTSATSTIIKAERSRSRSSKNATLAKATTQAENYTELTEEERETENEKIVDAFDAETDRWMDAARTKPPTIEEVDVFVAKFKAIPKDRREECLHRALNLVPDENVMLLVGILMDKSIDKELIELVYSDVLNRDELVKQPILKKIYADKSHPCWADTAWILDVTGAGKN